MNKSGLYINGLLNEIKSYKNPISIMEVCGTHTMAIAKSGIHQLLPPNIKLKSGPGCPVCVTSQGDIDAVIELARRPDIILCTFGDMVRVPGSESSLAGARGQGAEVRIVYSPLEALEIAVKHFSKEVVFLGIGFETTAPAVAICIEEAGRRNISNFSVLSLHKLVPPALEALFSSADINIDALICPGHVSAVIGLKPYEELVRKYNKPCVITGFELQDILEGMVMILRQAQGNHPQAEIQYLRVVKPEGNILAQSLMKRVFTITKSPWRGLGTIPASGLEVREEYKDFNTREKLGVKTLPEKTLQGCRCGDVLSARINPDECALFGRICTPLKPVGPCMVSHEGACAAFYRYIPLRSNGYE
jgi:hydrogenase expression/formation protein HypD